MALIEGGGSFEQPPAHAPRETTTPGSERATAAQIARAQAHEQELPPFAPKALSREAVKAITGKYPEEIAGPDSALHKMVQLPGVATVTVGVAPVAPQPFVSSRRRVIRPAVGASDHEEKVAQAALKILGIDPHVGQPTVVLTDAPDPLTSGERAYVEESIANLAAAPAPAPVVAEPPAPPPLAPPEPHQRAASNTDTPSRGIPTFSADPNKQITGGFGVPGEGPADYFPLDGTELRRVVEILLSEVHDRIQDDLRFSMACTYPRVSARVEVIIEAYGYDKPIVIPRVARPHDKTVLATAKAMADEVCFVVAAERAEFDAAGHPLTAPNRMRQEVGVEIPHKQRIRTPSGGSMWIDKSS